MVSKETFIYKCLEIIKRPEIKNEIKIFLRPIIDLILQEIYPYIYLSFFFVVISFLLILAIFILLLKNHQLKLNI
jgi:hypothetical protein